jgi:hypothetical protein
VLDIRATAYTSPLAEVDFASVALTVRISNVADETGLVTGTFRIYNDTTGLLIHTSDITPFSLAAGATVDVSALTDFDPPAPADDTYFVNFDGHASNDFALGSFHFDVKPVGMGPAPAAHHATHEDGGSDELDVTGLAGLTGPHTYLDLSENAAPGAPAVNVIRIYAFDSKGFTLLGILDSGGMTRQLVRDSVFIGRNMTGSPIPAFRLVYASGSSTNVPTIALAKADAIATMPAIGITLEAIADNAYGRVMQAGLAENVNTNAFNEGDVLYVSAATAGLVTATPPTYPNIRQEVGTILVKHVSAGAAQVIARSMLYEPIINIDGLLTSELDPNKRLAPDGAGGVTWV